MIPILRTWLALPVALALGAAAHAQSCVGEVVKPPEGLREVQDDALLASALGQPGKGALCKGKVFQADQPVTLYRVYDASKSYTLYGRWWSLEAPQGPRSQYQQQNAICPEWSPLNVVSACRLKVGSRVVIGPGQSAQCAASSIPASAVNQVYVPNDSRNNVLFVENCTEAQAWP